jgi:hypothetical protein
MTEKHPHPHRPATTAMVRSYQPIKEALMGTEKAGSNADLPMISAKLVAMMLPRTWQRYGGSSFHQRKLPAAS